MFGLLIALVQTAPAPPPDYYVKVCAAIVPLDGGGRLSGQIAVRDDGTVDSFSASAEPTETPLDRAFNLRQFAGVGAESNARWTMRWSGGGGQQRPEALAFDAATLQLDLGWRRKLPGRLAATLRRNDTDSVAVVAVGSRSFTKTSASFEFPLPYVLGIGSARPALAWTLYRAPFTGTFGTDRWLGSGSLPLDPIRAVAPAFAAFKRDLLAKVANAGTTCPREGVSISPAAEI